jgi:hypothetical protein
MLESCAVLEFWAHVSDSALDEWAGPPPMSWIPIQTSLMRPYYRIYQIPRMEPIHKYMVYLRSKSNISSLNKTSKRHASFSFGTQKWQYVDLARVTALRYRFTYVGVYAGIDEVPCRARKVGYSPSLTV